LLPEATADKGAARLFFTRENRDDTSVYEDWSFSSSSEKGLKDVKLVTSSSLVLLRDLPDNEEVEGPLIELGTGE
jgi:hypothetical protein